jgi:hypothetical protein
MAAISNYFTNKMYILENLNLSLLFDYLVMHKYMSCADKETILNKIFKGYNMGGAYKTKLCHEIFVEHFLFRYMNPFDCYDNIIFKSLVASGQKDVVMRLFPDFIEKSHERALYRIDHLVFDANKMLKYIEDNNIPIPPDVRRVKPTKTHTMKTRADDKVQVQNNNNVFVKTVLKSRVQRDDFDYNTDPLFKALSKTGYQKILHTIFPECYQSVSFN